jgi:proteasome lid subunit RPN8/RPN11
MYIHSYLSKHEVIGLLGGITYQRENIKYLVISKIYNAESCIQSQTVRLKNCEISDEEQIKIQDLMDKDGVQKLAWYHSHPIFEVDPSI